MLYCKHTFITNNIHKGKVCYVWNRMPGTQSLTSHTEFSFNCVQPYIQGTAETADAVAETEITWSLTRTVGTSTLLARPPSLFSIIITILGNSRVTGIVCRRYYFLTELFCIPPPFFEFRLFDRTAIGWLIHGSELGYQLRHAAYCSACRCVGHDREPCETPEPIERCRVHQSAPQRRCGLSLALL